MKNITNVLKEVVENDDQSVIDPKEKAERQAKEYNDRKVDDHGYSCDKCNGSGRIMIASFNDDYGWQTVLQDCECMPVRIAMKNARDSGLGDYVTKRFDDYVANDEWQKVIKRKAIAYCKNQSENWFIVCGQSGAGKTLICSIISNYILKVEHKKVKYVTWTDFISKLKRDLMTDDVKEVNRYLDEIKNIDVLYIDELLKKYNETDLKYIIEIINYRYTNHLQTIISSEKTIDELLDIDEATFSRTVERSGEYVSNIPRDRKKNQRINNFIK